MAADAPLSRGPRTLPRKTTTDYRPSFLGPNSRLVCHVCPIWVSCGGVFVESVLAEKLALLRPVLNERQWRLLLGAEALAVGHGGIAVVTRASGAARSTVSIGLREVRTGMVVHGRIRAPGAGRRRVGEVQPGVAEALEDLITPAMRGDQISLLRWTSKSSRSLVKGLAAAGYAVSQRTVARLLQRLGYQLHTASKAKEWVSPPDRDAQFCYIDASAQQFLDARDPVVSLACKKKEVVGDHAKGGREYQLGSPAKINGHNNLMTGAPRAISYEVHGLDADEGWASVGIDDENAAFAVNTLRTWWRQEGSARYPQARRLMLAADGGDANGYRRRAFKVELAAFAAEARLDVTVCHFPPGTSRWERTEHRFVSFASTDWQDRPFTELQTVLELIAHTTTETGLTASSYLDGAYAVGVQVIDAELADIPLTPHDFHGEWNYTISGRKSGDPLAAVVDK
ncbi:ISAzo13 family transposase [Micromonospora marina]|uniref:Rhodopirellula transposase DDE domain-containing protein n=1 Tax=Micromonospora marina TaxID=307120 RepID=A0A1C5AIF0_9ACTN|nr:Rhodopirellula transposase DDE domain-containing protein [Micromonospora marina]